MRRGEFLVKAGKGVLLVCAGSCMVAGCSSGDDGGGTPNPPDNGGGDNTVSVSLTSLSNIGDQTKRNGVLFFRIGAGNTASDFVATEAICPHQGGSLVWQQDEGLIECQLHFSQYEPDGDTIRGPQNASGTTRDLIVYPVSVSGGNVIATV